MGDIKQVELVPEGVESDLWKFGERYIRFKEYMLRKAAQFGRGGPSDEEALGIYDQYTRIRNTDKINERGGAGGEKPDGDGRPDRPTDKQIELMRNLGKWREGGEDKIRGFLKQMNKEKLDQLTYREGKQLIEELDAIPKKEKKGGF